MGAVPSTDQESRGADRARTIRTHTRPTMNSHRTKPRRTASKAASAREEMLSLR